MLSSAGCDQIAADEDEREQHQDEIERVQCSDATPFFISGD